MTRRPIEPVSGLAEFKAFAARLSKSARFDPHAEVVVGRAPGRLDVMGGIADYSGALVLQLPLADAAFVAVQRTTEPSITLATTNTAGRAADATMPLAELLRLDPAAARAHFARDPSRHWAAFGAGALLMLCRERHLRPAGGVRVWIDSAVPEGIGVASSAAVGVAAMQALASTFDVKLTPRDLALMSQKVENEVAGAACGVMDQMTAACGRAGELLALLCQPAEIEGFVPIPSALALFGIDSGIRHVIAGADYSSVRAATFMGYRILAELLGLPVHGQGPVVAIEDHRWHGFLANLDAHELEHDYAHALPNKITGREFVARYGGTTDPLTRIEPDRVYPVRTAVLHPVHEHARSQTFRALLQGPSEPTDWLALGELMYQAHASMSACGLGSDGTDLLVELVQQAEPEQGLFGAKITGGGCGGAVAVLARADAQAAVAKVAAEYAQQTGRQARVFGGSSAGAAAFGVKRLAGR